MKPAGVVGREELTAHPVERKQVPARRKWIVPALLILAAASAYFLWPRLQKLLPGRPAAVTGAPKRGSGGAVTVSTALVQRGDVDVFLNGLGTVTPIYTVTVKSRVDGQLMQVRYTEGQLVNKGDLLVEIDPRPYQVQLEQAEGQLKKDQAVLENARIDLARYQKLWSQNAIPQQQLATQQAMVAQQEATLESDQAQIDSAKLNLIYTEITAPITGRTGLRLVDPGNIVHASDNTGLVVITQLQPISVIFTIPEDQLPAVLKQMRQGRGMRVEAWDRELTRKMATGRLITLDNQIDQTTGTLKLRAQFENTDNSLFPSQFVNARLLVERKTGVAVAPQAAVQRGAKSAYAYLVRPDHTVTVRPVDTGAVENDMVEIKSGLAPGDTVVTDGVDKLQEGTRIAERGSAGNPRGRGAAR